MRRNRTTVFLLLMVVIFLSLGRPAQAAEVNVKDIQTVVRTIGFLENSPRDGNVMAVIYDAADRQSVQSARQVVQMIRDSHRDLEPRLVSVAELERGLADASYAFVSRGMDAHFDRVRTLLNKNEVLSFTVDRACIDQECCAVYINSRDRVEIVVNKSLTDLVRVQFKSVFLMLVTVI